MILTRRRVRRAYTSTARYTHTLYFPAFVRTLEVRNVRNVRNDIVSQHFNAQSVRSSLNNALPYATSIDRSCLILAWSKVKKGRKPKETDHHTAVVRCNACPCFFKNQTRRLHFGPLSSPLRISIFQLRRVFYFDVDALWDTLQHVVSYSSKNLRR